MIKIDTFKRLPTHLCGLAHAEEDIARACGKRCIEAFERDPRREAHDDRTLYWMRKDCHLRRQLELFVAGKPRDECSLEFLEEVAALYFVPCVETTIEEKYARVANTKRARHLGPVAVSLANRFPMVISQVRAGQFDMVKFLHLFGLARKIMDTPYLLQLENHPELGRVKQTPSSIVPIMSRIIYNCDITSMYHSKKEAAVAAKKATDKEVRRVANLIKATQPSVVSRASVLSHAMLDHLCKVACADSICSLPRSLVGFKSIEETLADPETKKRRTEAKVMDDDSDSGLRVDDGGVGQELAPEVFFNLVFKNPEKKKRVRPAVGAGGHIGTGSKVVVIREQRQPATDTAVLQGYSCRSGASSDAVAFLHGLKDVESDEVVEAFQEGWLQWQASGVGWFIEGVGGGVAAQVVSRVAASLMGANAFPGEHSSLGYLPLPDEVPVLEQLAHLGFAELQGQRWMVTREGVQRMRCDTRVAALAKVFVVRDNVSLGDRTLLECLMLLEKGGWKW